MPSLCSRKCGTMLGWGVNLCHDNLCAVNSTFVHNPKLYCDHCIQQPAPKILRVLVPGPAGFRRQTYPGGCEVSEGCREATPLHLHLMCPAPF